jgi:predicted RNA binding protein YcfA (HicA-like mRNA interferase family)
MVGLPILSAQEIIKGLQKIGYRKIRQKGSHIRLACAKKRSVTVPNHKTISRGLLRKILRDAEISPEEFQRFLKK